MACTSLIWPRLRRCAPQKRDESAVLPVLPSYAEVTKSSDVDDVIGKEVSSRSAELRQVSVKMWGMPEVAWKEHKTHDLLVEYMQKQQGWRVTAHAYGLETAFNAIFEHKPKGFVGDCPVIGLQSEMDALPGIGHACGHNLIAVSGLAAALGLAKAAVDRDFAVRVVLIGTPAEEASGGKRVLLKKGAYKGMDVCLMLHPAPLDSVGTMLAVQQISVKYVGHPAHAGAAPWEGINAQDAGVLAYVNISALRQQIPPTQRVHGIIQGKNWAPNVIPDSCELIFNTRAESSVECDKLTERVKKCFTAAAEATGCKCTIDVFSAYKDVANNQNLADAYCQIAQQRYKREVTSETFSASTDFGDVTYAMPALHAEYAIPLRNPLTDKNHTEGFAQAAKTQNAHDRTMEASVLIAAIGARIASDRQFREQTWEQWRRWRREKEAAGLC